jgi:hypothetical protein
MRKEIILVIIASVLFGAIIAFGIWRANSALRDNNKGSIASSDQYEVVEENTSEKLGLTIAEPSQDDVITEDTITLSGITAPGSWVVITTNEDDYIFQSDSSGGFENEIQLSGGINQITTTVFDENGNSINETLRVVYSSEFADYLDESSEN